MPRGTLLLGLKDGIGFFFFFDDEIRTLPAIPSSKLSFSSECISRSGRFSILLLDDSLMVLSVRGDTCCIRSVSVWVSSRTVAFDLISSVLATNLINVQ